MGIDRVPELVALSTENLQKDGFQIELDDGNSSYNKSRTRIDGRDASGECVNSKCCRVLLRVGDGWNTSDAKEQPQEGKEEDDLFDAIHVGAAPPHLPPALLQRLKPGGRMVVPVGPPRGTWQEWRCVDRASVKDLASGAEEEFSSHVISSVRFVPLKVGIGPN